MIFKHDCFHWVGRKPCAPQLEGRTPGCNKCPLYHQILGNVLIIEAGGLGSILRTTTVSKEIKRLHPSFVVQWLTNKKGAELLSKNVESIDRVLTFDNDSVQTLLGQKFNMVINFELVPRYLSLAKRIEAQNKFGYVMSNLGQIKTANDKANEFLRLQTDDHFRKKENDKPMQQILLEATGLTWRKQTYDLTSLKEDDNWAKGFFYENGIDTNKGLVRVIGFNIGTSHKLKTKRWGPESFHQLAQMINKKFSTWKIMILAGPEDISQYESFKEINSNKPIDNLIFSGYSNPISKFISLIKNIPLIVSSDTFGMHVAIGLKKSVVALFGPQPSQEVCLYDCGQIVKLDLSCIPCFKGKPEQCSNVNRLACMQHLEPQLVFNELEKQIVKIDI